MAKCIGEFTFFMVHAVQFYLQVKGNFIVVVDYVVIRDVLVLEGNDFHGCH